MTRIRVFAAVLLVFVQPLAIADSYLFDMDVLPSADGATYLDNVVAEASVAQIVNGQLLIDTTGQGSDVPARYGVDDPWNTSVDAVLTWKARVEALTGGNRGAEVAMIAANDRAVNLIMESNRIVYLDDSLFFVPFSPNVSVDTSNFHTYKVKINANSNHFDFFIDGQWVGSGSVPLLPGKIPRLLFGDGTTSGGNSSIRFKQVKLENCGFVNK